MIKLSEEVTSKSELDQKLSYAKQIVNIKEKFLKKVKRFSSEYMND